MRTSFVSLRSLSRSDPCSYVSSPGISGFSCGSSPRLKVIDFFLQIDGILLGETAKFVKILTLAIVQIDLHRYVISCVILTSSEKIRRPTVSAGRTPNASQRRGVATQRPRHLIKQDIHPTLICYDRHLQLCHRSHTC